MKRLCWAALVSLLITTPGVVLGALPPSGVAPSDDCTAPVVQIEPLDFYWGSSVNNTDDTDLGDLSSCAAGTGGTSPDGGDFVYELVLGPGHDVTCSVTAWDDEMAYVLSTSCDAPLGAGACLWGEVAPAGGTPISFNTVTLGLAAGTYYLWGDRTPTAEYTWWTLDCTGTIPVELQLLQVE